MLHAKPILAAGANEEQCSKSHALISQDALTVANYTSTVVVIENRSSMLSCSYMDFLPSKSQQHLILVAQKHYLALAF
jgi:hypothetical protein